MKRALRCSANSTIDAVSRTPVTNVYTRPSHRGRGVGAKLLTATTEWARQEGLEVLVVWPSEGSVSLYHRQGFDSPDIPLVWSNPDAD